MRFLAIDTAGSAVQAALSVGTHFSDANQRNASAVLLPAIDTLLSQAKWTPRDLSFIACVTGPGSFTGIRIGISTARAMCYALKKPAVGMHGHVVLAYNERADGAQRILCVSDGSNGTAYVTELDADRAIVMPCVCLPQADAVQLAETYKGTVCVDTFMARQLPRAVPPDTNGRSLLRAAEALRDTATDAEHLLPLYVRESQAERDLKAREEHVAVP